MLSRVVALTVDFFVIYAVWTVVGIVLAQSDLPQYSSAGIALYLLVIDVPLTALFGASAGRFLAGIRVLRTADGRPPGWARAFLRVALVAATGPVGLGYWLVASFFGIRLGGSRLWWDVAAGTALVRRARNVATPVESEATRR